MNKITGIKYIGPIFNNSGYAKACRGNIFALLSQGVPVTLSPISFENISPELGKDGEVLEELINKDIEYNVVIVHTTPEFWERHKESGKTMVNYTIWETTKLHPDWVPYINNSADKVMVGCEWNVNIFKDSGVTVPVCCIPHTIDKDDNKDIEPYDISGISDSTYVFGFVSQWCYDDKTRVLTSKGFKYFKDLSYEDELATMNLSNEQLEYHRPSKIVSFDRKDKMVKLKSQAFDLCVTPDHKMVVKHSKSDAWILKPFNELISKKRNGSLVVNSSYRAKKSCLWEGVQQEYFKLGGSDISMEPFLEFLGWYLSEGSTLDVGNGYVTSITQKKVEYIPEILACCKNAGLHTFFGGNANKDIRISSKDLHMYLAKFGKCYEKYVPSFIKNLSSKQILLFLTALFKGDGTLNKDGSFRKYVTTSQQLAEDVQECLLKVGMSGAICTEDPTKKVPGSIDGREIRGKRLQYIVSVNSKQTEPSMHYANLDVVDYSGKVHCTTVENHNMFVERNGKVLFSGNTERKDPISLLKAYWLAFQKGEDVALVMKTYRSDYSDQEKDAIRTTIKRLKQVTVFDNYPKINFIPDMLSEDEMRGLYKRIDCYCTLDRGEGFGLSPFTAGAYGKPVIATGFGGVTEYLKEDNSYLVNYLETPVFGMPFSPWYRAEQCWAQADIIDGSNMMCDVFNNQEEAKEKGSKLQEYINTNFSYRAVGKRIIKEIEEVL